MATYDQIVQAMQKAYAIGDTASAKRFGASD